MSKEVQSSNHIYDNSAKRHVKLMTIDRYQVVSMTILSNVTSNWWRLTDINVYRRQFCQKSLYIDDDWQMSSSIDDNSIKHHIDDDWQMSIVNLAPTVKRHDVSMKNCISVENYMKTD